MKYLLIILTCLAFESPGDIIYSGEQSISPYGGFSIDLNSDSLGDVDIFYDIVGTDSQPYSETSGSLGARMVGLNRIVVASSNSYNAALSFNTPISGTLDPSLEWKEGETIVLPGGEYFARATARVSGWFISTYPPGTETGWSGLFGETGSAYIGVSIDEMDGPHYGWINVALDLESSSGFGFPFITGWAYESDPNTAIMAGAIPEPSSGVLTMIGTLSLLQLPRSRRRRKQGCTPMPRYRSPQIRCGFPDERRVAPVVYGNADRISALRRSSHI